MIAEDILSIGESPDHAGGTAPGRHNRNLSDIVSTIRDDGPSTAGERDSYSHVEIVETPRHDAPVQAAGRRRVRLLPGVDVMSKVTAALLLVILAGGATLLATGKYPVIDERGLHLTDLPAGVVTEMAAIKAGVQDTFAQWTRQAGALLSDISVPASDTQVSGVPGLVAMEARQQLIMERLDRLESRFERDQVDRLVHGFTHRTEQDLQLEAVRAQLTGLQQQLADDRVAVSVSPPVVPPTGKVGKPVSGQGGWVVNVASSSQEEPIRQLQAKLGKQDIVTEMQRIEIKGEPRFRLSVTGFNTGGEARVYAGKLAQEAGISGAWVSKR